ncbi:MAG TPA: hypothetical protein VF070_48695 [Streptosporangiaceae bacterium]
METAAASGWALYELPALIQRGTISYNERAVAGVPLTASRIAVGAAHRDQARAIRAALNGSGVTDVTVDTANAAADAACADFAGPRNGN